MATVHDRSEEKIAFKVVRQTSMEVQPDKTVKKITQDLPGSLKVNGNIIVEDIKDGDIVMLTKEEAKILGGKKYLVRLTEKIDPAKAVARNPKGKKVLGKEQKEEPKKGKDALNKSEEDEEDEEKDTK